MRKKAALIVIAIAFVITAANFGSSMFLSHQSLTESMGKDITFALDIANDLMSTRINLYKSNAQTTAERLLNTGSVSGMNAAMREKFGQFPDFMAFTVFDRQGAVTALGDSPAAADWLKSSKYIQSAFEGGTVISTTMYNEETGKLVMYICTPMDEGRVLAVTIPGMSFSYLLSNYMLWDTGSLWMIDEEGVVIAHIDPAMVDSRTNYLAVIEQSGIYSFLYDLLSNERGLGSYVYNGAEYQCAYARVSAMESDWRIGLSVPVAESPLTRVQNCLAFLAALFFIISIIVAVLTSRYLAKPYDKIAEQNNRLEELRQITQSQADKIEDALKDAQDANYAKSRFLATMSHEMRTPLNAVIGLSELILDEGNVHGDDEDKVGKIHTSGMTLLGIVNDILDISKIESGKFELHPIEYDTPGLINDIVALNIVRLDNKPVTFKLYVENLPELLIGDDLRVKQIFSNLLSNAFKYTNSGYVQWRVSFERDGDSVWLVSTVKDTGIGVRPEDMHKLFLDYSQVNAGTNRNAEGTGLGLSITKRLLDMMDGEISCESEYGKGSAFTVRLRQKFVKESPIVKETAQSLIDNYSAQRRAKRAGISRIDLSGAHVLVVDDVQANMDVVRGMLKPYGMKVDCADSGMQAIDMIREGSPRYDAVFMDHMMPVMDGIEAVRIIREEIDSDYARTVPVIALTANAIAGTEKMFLEKGFQAFISKPIDLKRLDSVLRKWIRDKDRRGLAINGIDINAGVKRFDGSEDMYISVLHAYSVSTRPLLHTLKEHLTAGNLSGYAIDVHGIKGSSYGVSAMQAGRTAEKLERLANDGEKENLTLKNDSFIEYMEKLLDSIDRTLDEYGQNTGKPAAAAPDGELLQALRKACEEYDAVKVDEIMAKLEGFKYESGEELVKWLRSQVDEMNFAEISGDERLSMQPS